MDTISLVDEQKDDGLILLERLHAAGIPVRAAGWVKPTDADRWSLYIVTPIVDQKTAMWELGNKRRRRESAQRR